MVNAITTQFARTAATLLAVVMCITGCAVTKPEPRRTDSIYPIWRDVQNYRIPELRVYYVSSRLSSYWAMGREGVVNHARYVIDAKVDEQMRRELLEVLSRTKTKPSVYGSDCRSGIHFLDVHGQMLHEIYLNRSGAGAIIDYQDVRINRHLSKWLRRNFKP